MHVMFRERVGLEDANSPVDLEQTPADLIVLSFSDSDLGAFAAGWRQGGGPQGTLPSLRLANLAALTHPLSVDTYVDQTLDGAKGILIRLIGGVPYWAYGIAQVEALARRHGLALAVLPADGRPDPKLDAVSTLPVSTLRRLAQLCDTGGAVAAQAALAQMALAAGLYAGPVNGAKVLPEVGTWHPDTGVACAAAAHWGATRTAPPAQSAQANADLRPRTSRQLDCADLTGGIGRVVLVFYRSYLVAADLAPVEALYRAFEAQGLNVVALFAPSLKAPAAANWVARQVAALAPDAIVNATAFSGRGSTGASPLDAAGCPVFQVALATSDRAAWANAERGLSPADLAMHVVLPEVDGRICAGVVSFKEPEPRDSALQFERFVHCPEAGRVAAVVARVGAWLRLARRPVTERRVALVLSSYPGKEWNLAHAVGLDALASADAMVADLAAAGYTVEQGATLEPTLRHSEIAWSVADYRDALRAVPAPARAALSAAWGAPEEDAACTDGAFRFRALWHGNVLIAVQPDRGRQAERFDDYHDLFRVPCHGYVAFYLWVRREIDALVHIGAHGTLEWLPGKAVALSEQCWPEILTGALPVLYPFIVNDPGEAAQAKRRIGAVTLGHVPPPLRQSGAPVRLVRLEALLDEFSTADGLDPARRDRLIGDIREEAQALGVEADLGLEAAACPAEAITRIDRFVCDVKESQFGDGLHIWGRAPADADGDVAAAAAAERASLTRALDGRRIEPGPAGSPYRGRQDVLPTGRNLFATDPRAVPSRAAHAQGVKLAEELIRRHLQDEGDYPKALVVDLWGSATMRTAGEEFAMALHLIGAKPEWDAGSARVAGVEILPIALLERPRIDVTLRVSGLFRDVFPGLGQLFGQAIRALADRDEALDWNPFVAAGARVYGPAPGSYGLGLGDSVETYGDAGRRAAGEAWLAASSWALDGAAPRRDADGIAARVAQADSFVHLQDLPETDLLLAADYAAHEAGFAAAKAVVGGPRVALWHLDATLPDRPRARALPEEIARVVRARAANPAWIAGMRRHGFRGAAEIAATLEHLAAFAQLADAVPAHLFDLYHDATLGDSDVTAFLAEANPGALKAMRARFAALHAAGLWKTRRNAILASLEMLP